MKIKHVSKTATTIILGGSEKALWQCSTADGPDVAEAQRRVRDRVDALFASGRRRVAPARVGGWVWDIYYADEDVYTTSEWLKIN